MKKFKRIMVLAIVFTITTSILMCSSIKRNITTASIATRKIVKIGILTYDLTNVYSSLIAESLKDIEKENPGKTEIKVFDGKKNPSIESELLNNMINENFDLILVTLATENLQEVLEDSIYKAKQKNIPIIFFLTKPVNLDALKGYKKSLIVNPDVAETGTLQGKMIADAWNANKKIIDKNGDDIMQYIIIKGKPGGFGTAERTESSLNAIADASIKKQELASVSADWDEEEAKSAVESLFLKFGNRIEVIIANNDQMAIGAVEGLQKYGYNMGDKEKTIPVFGADGIQKAKELIEKGFMAGTIPQNPRIFAEVLYTIGMNLVSGKNPLEGTSYEFDKSGVIVNVPSTAPKGTYF